MMDVRENAISVLRSLPSLPDAALLDTPHEQGTRSRLHRAEVWESASSATMVSEGSWNSSHSDRTSTTSAATASSWESRRRRRAPARRNSVSTLASMPSGDPRAALRGLGLGVVDAASARRSHR